jgi:hypothetical protein
MSRPCATHTTVTLKNPELQEIFRRYRGLGPDEIHQSMANMSIYDALCRRYRAIRYPEIGGIFAVQKLFERQADKARKVRL